MIHGELTWLAAFVAGLLSSGHCLGMCGGIAGGLGSGGPRAPVRGALYNGLFNLGRIGSYAFAGALIGGFGLALGAVIDLPAWSAGLRVATGVLMVAIGLQFAINWRGLRRIEAVGGVLWQRIAPLTRRLLPVKSAPAALGLGALWGWLPCGLVYTMLLTAATTGEPVQASLLMLAFGTGTLPAMMGIGTAAAWLPGLLSSVALRRTSAALLIGFGVWTVWGAVSGPALHLHLGALCT